MPRIKGVSKNKSADGWMDKLMEQAEREADICLSCPLKKCRPYQCTRYKKEMISRGLYEGNSEHLR